MGFSGTLTVLYEDASGANVAIHGMPTLSQLPKILNVPEQAVTDPKLQTFSDYLHCADGRQLVLAFKSRNPTLTLPR